MPGSQTEENGQSASENGRQDTSQPGPVVLPAANAQENGQQGHSGEGPVNWANPYYQNWMSELRQVAAEVLDMDIPILVGPSVAPPVPTNPTPTTRYPVVPPEGLTYQNGRFVVNVRCRPSSDVATNVYYANLGHRSSLPVFEDWVLNAEFWAPPGSTDDVAYKAVLDEFMSAEILEDWRREDDQRAARQYDLVGEGVYMERAAEEPLPLIPPRMSYSESDLRAWRKDWELAMGLRTFMVQRRLARAGRRYDPFMGNV